jgi:catechol-2,3-dioxygenase
MAVTGFSHINLRAPLELIEQLRAFYVDVVGLRVGPRAPLNSFGYWLYAGEQEVIHLSVARDSEPNRVPSAVGTYDHLALSCNGLVGTREHLQRHGIAFTTRQVPGNGPHQLFFKDPAGNGVELNFSPDDVF